jgi:hypothetical protein
MVRGEVMIKHTADMQPYVIYGMHVTQTCESIGSKQVHLSFLVCTPHNIAPHLVGEGLEVEVFRGDIAEDSLKDHLPLLLL